MHAQRTKNTVFSVSGWGKRLEYGHLGAEPPVPSQTVSYAGLREFCLGQFSLSSQVNPSCFCFVFSFIQDSTEDKKLSIFFRLFRVFYCLFCGGCFMVSTKCSIFTENKTCLGIRQLMTFKIIYFVGPT